jgi:hypothetical protein
MIILTREVNKASIRLEATSHDFVHIKKSDTLYKTHVMNVAFIHFHGLTGKIILGSHLLNIYDKSIYL